MSAPVPGFNLDWLVWLASLQSNSELWWWCSSPFLFRHWAGSIAVDGYTCFCSTTGWQVLPGLRHPVSEPGQPGGILQHPCLTLPWQPDPQVSLRLLQAQVTWQPWFTDTSGTGLLPLLGTAVCTHKLHLPTLYSYGNCYRNSIQWTAGKTLKSGSVDFMVLSFMKIWTDHAVKAVQDTHTFHKMLLLLIVECRRGTRTKKWSEYSWSGKWKYVRIYLWQGILILWLGGATPEVSIGAQLRYFVLLV